MNYDTDYSGRASQFAADSLRLEAVTACVGFDDMLDVTLALNHPHLDTMIVVTSHDDTRTQLVAKKHGAICVQTDLFQKNERHFNKGAAINAGLGRFQYYGWRLCLDADIALPDNARRMLFNHTKLDPGCIYGADRIDVIGAKDLAALKSRLAASPQAAHGFLVDPAHQRPMGARYVDTLRGYCPMGFFQLWNARCDKPYPWSLGNAAHDDVMFADLWPGTQRRLLPSLICYHICSKPPVMGENWDGHRQQPRLS